MAVEVQHFGANEIVREKSQHGSLHAVNIFAEPRDGIDSCCAILECRIVGWLTLVSSR